MSVLVILCHPAANSFNHEIARVAMQGLDRVGVEAIYHDLYRESFDPVLAEEEIRRRFSFDEKVQAYSREVTKADGYFFVHPDWWGMPPALLKGWLDRVFRPGVAYDYEGQEFVKKERVPLLVGKRGFVVCTTERVDRDGSDGGSGGAHPVEALWREAIFEFCGITEVSVRVLDNLRTTTLRRRRAWLAEIEKETASFFSRMEPKI